jgi:hypothetical protein
MEIVLLLKVKISRKLLHENVVKLSDLYEIYRDIYLLTRECRLFCSGVIPPFDWSTPQLN